MQSVEGKVLRTGVDKKAEVMRKTGRSSKGIRGGGGR